MSVSSYNQISSTDRKLENISNKNINYIKEFINTANSRLDAINSITNNSHAIAADAVTAMICENQYSVIRNQKNNSVIQTSHTSEIRNISILKD